MARNTKATKSKAAFSASDPQTSIPASRNSAASSNGNAESQITLEELNSSSVSIQEKVALMAYGYWEKRGMQGGTPEEDWYRAEKEVLDQLGLSNR